MIYAQSEKGNQNAGGDTCQYAMLDTIARTITYKRLDDDLKWIEKCNDVRVFGEDVYCVVALDSSIFLYVNTDMTDSVNVFNYDNFASFWKSYPDEFM